MKLKPCCQIILLAVCASLLSITAWAQDEREPKSPVEFKLTTQMTAFCVGSPLKLELEVTNNGQYDFAFRRMDLWREFSYSSSTKNGSSIGGMSRQPDNAEGGLILHPGESYRSTFELPLDAAFFQAAGTYTVNTKLYQLLFSNDVEFELYDCGKPQEVKEQNDD